MPKKRTAPRRHIGPKESRVVPVQIRLTLAERDRWQRRADVETEGYLSSYVRSVVNAAVNGDAS